MNIIAFCGIDCAQCDTYRATLANDDSMRRETASRWSKDFGFDLSFMDINCSGCHGDVHFRRTMVALSRSVVKKGLFQIVENAIATLARHLTGF
ncbi:DUF3795 domain-containing protein [Mesotoga sp. UBA5825]|uniref:DUF3795 domain-containing protein n=1 Tax=Mesotoga sp. UBA5825 TaxID=1946858 RepID=UPI0025F6A64F|nr:DUF3795 domain-containing protein [Mesotoga sp. UBA5825]